MNMETLEQQQVGAAVVGPPPPTTTHLHHLSSKYSCFLPDIISSDEKVAALLEATKNDNSKSDASKWNWLCPELHCIIDANAPTDDDKDEQGVYDPVKLQAASQKLYQELPTAFCNSYQLRQVLEGFCSNWGFHIKSRGCAVYCHFGKTTNENRQEEYDNYNRNKEVSPSKKRSRRRLPDNVLVDCPWVYRYSVMQRTTGLATWQRPVHITSVVHSHTCTCSESVQAAARKHSGYTSKTFSDNDFQQIWSLRNKETGRLECQVLRQVLQQRWGVDPKEITSVAVHNLRSKVARWAASGRGSVLTFQDLERNCNELRDVVAKLPMSRQQKFQAAICSLTDLARGPPTDNVDDSLRELLSSVSS
jgi:hypothetical protein